MNKRMLSTFLWPAMLAANTVGAVSLSTNGIGQALVYPFYTVDNNQDTLLSVVNASATGKAVQVSFREGHAGRRVLDLVVFLKSHDVWTASVSADAATGGAVLRTSDTSCTLPAVPSTGRAFTSASYDGSLGYPNDGGPYDITRLREGMLDLIVGGDIAAGSPTDLATQHRTGVGGTSAAPDCASLDSVTYYNDLVPPAGGIYGSGSVVDVGTGTYFTYNAEALADFTRTVLLSRLRQTPPGLEDANTGNGPGDVESDILDDAGHPIHLAHNFAPDAVSAVFMATALYNDYIVDPNLGAATDWVVTFPTVPAYSLFAQSYNTTSEVRDREEGGLTPCVSCAPFVAVQTLHVVNVIGVTGAPYATGMPTGVFGSNLNTFPLTPYGNAGSIRFFFDFQIQTFEGAIIDANPGLSLSDADFNSVRLLGAPAVGFMAYNIINAHAQPGLLANYGGAFAHRASFRCQGPAGVCPEPYPTP